MELNRWRPIIPVIAEFQSYISTEVQPLKIIAATDRNWTETEYKRFRPSGFPSRLRGVYLIFDPLGKLLYVGVAILSYDKRVWSHDNNLERRWIDIIPFEDKYVFFALSLEFLLITRLKPPFNKTYKDYNS